MESFMKAVSSIADSLVRIADALEKKNQVPLPLETPVAETPAPAKPKQPKPAKVEIPAPIVEAPKVETPAPAGEVFTLDQLKALATEAVATGHVASVKALIEKFKAKSVSTIDPKFVQEAYGILKSIVG